MLTRARAVFVFAPRSDIDAALSETDKLIHHTNVASESDDLVNQRSITSDYKGYLEWTEAVHAAIVYFQNNSQFKNSEKLLKKLVRPLPCLPLAACVRHR